MGDEADEGLLKTSSIEEVCRNVCYTAVNLLDLNVSFPVRLE